MLNINNKNHRTFLFLILAFLVPMGLSGLLYHYHEHFQFKTLHHGTLVSPPINLKEQETQLGNDKKWKILYITGDFCNNQCEKVTASLNQIKKALGKDRERVNVMTKPSLVISGSLQHREIFLNNKENRVAIKKVYLVDPAGNLFMYYPDTTDPINILKDLKRVLGVSQIG